MDDDILRHQFQDHICSQATEKHHASSMQKPLMRIPYTGALPDPLIIPRSATTPQAAASAIRQFLLAPPSPNLQRNPPFNTTPRNDKTVILTGAGISVASGLADYRGKNGTYTQNKAYRPIYYHEFISNHEARKRYWARSFLGWTNLNKSRPNRAHEAVKGLGVKGLVGSVITQNVDSFHSHAHPDLPTVELHGYLRSLVCINCHQELPRAEFQKSLSSLNPAWATFLAEMLETGALDTENPTERRARGLTSNPDGDVDVPGAPYTTFRYPACPRCLANPPVIAEGKRAMVGVDSDGAWSSRSNAGILKPAVIMFGESIASNVKAAAETAVDESSRMLVVGSSLATYSAWRLVKHAHEKGMPIGILNIGGVRKEELFFDGIDEESDGSQGVRCSQSAEGVLPLVEKSISL